MTYAVCNIADDRCVFKHKKYDRYYVRNRWDMDDDLDFWTTTDLDEAKEVLEATKKNWGDHWVIVNKLGEVVK